MKTLNVMFAEENHKFLVQRKGSRNWHDFILEIAKKEEEKENELQQHRETNRES